MFWKRSSESDYARHQARTHLRYTTDRRHSFANPLFPKKEPARPLERFSFRGKFILCVLVFFGMAGVLMYSDILRIKNVYVEGNEELSSDDIRRTVQTALETRRWFILPQSNILLLSSDRLKDALNSTYVFEFIDTDKHFRYQTLSVNVKERIPGITFMSQNTTYYLDLKGVVTREVGEGEDVRKTFPVVKDHNNRETNVKDQMMSENMIQSLLSIHTLLPAQTSFTINSYVLPKVTCRETIQEEVPVFIESNANSNSNASVNASPSNVNAESTNANNSQKEIQRMVTVEKEIEAPCENYLTTIKALTVRTNEGPEILFDITRAIEGQVEKLKISLAQELPDVKMVEYIDLRFEDRVFYRKK